jgi:Ala-tRNA(Pro) deacylase
MIPQRIAEYLESHAVQYESRLHRRAITAQELAATVHVPGRRVAKSVMVKAGEKVWIAVLPATEVVDEKSLAAVLDAPTVRLLRESEFQGLFPDCEAGAEPPFGGLFGLPVVVDSTPGSTECARGLDRLARAARALRWLRWTKRATLLRSPVLSQRRHGFA